MTWVRGVIWAAKASTISPGDSGGVGSGTLRIRTCCVFDMCSHMRWTEGYSWSLMSTSPPGCRGSPRAGTFMPIVVLSTRATFLSEAPVKRATFSRDASTRDPMSSPRWLRNGFDSTCRNHSITFSITGLADGPTEPPCRNVTPSSR